MRTHILPICKKGLLGLSFLLCGLISSAHAQNPAAAEVESIEAIIETVYASIGRAPGEAFDWDRFRSLFLADAILIPNVEQTDGVLRVLSVSEYIGWNEGFTNVDDPEDRGIEEGGYFSKIDRYGDVAHVLSSYREHYWGEEAVLTQGVNSFQVIWNSASNRLVRT